MRIPCSDYPKCPILPTIDESSGVTARGRGREEGGRIPPLTFVIGKFLLMYRENGGKEKREYGQEKKENCCREGRKFEMEGKFGMAGDKCLKMNRGPFYFYLFIYLFIF